MQALRTRPWWPSIPAWPSRCAVCSLWPAQPVCADCARRFAPRTPWRGPLPAPDWAPGPPFGTWAAAVDYDHPWDRLVARFKFQGQAGWARLFAQWMREHPDAPGVLGAAQWVVPVPLTPARLAERGLHAPRELARALLRPGPTGRLLDALVRLNESPAQHRLARQDRLRNLRGAFVAHPALAAPLLGARVLLVDDVMTTGATLQAAAQALRAAGAAAVDALVFARTPGPPGAPL